MQNLIQIEEKNGVQMVESRVIALELNIQHKNLVETIRTYQGEIESAFGRVAFETAPLQTAGGIQGSTVAYLTEDQAIFIATLSRNSEQVVRFKARLVQAFQSAKRLAQQLTAPMSDEELFAMALQKSAKLLEAKDNQIKMLAHESEMKDLVIQAQAPLADYAKMITETKGASYRVTSIAAEVGLSGTTLNKILLKKGIIRYVKKKWCPTTKYLNRGLADFITKEIKDKNGDILTTTTEWFWLEPGRYMIHQLFKQSIKVAA